MERQALVSTRMYPTVFTVPAGTAIATPVKLPVVLEDNLLDNVDIVIPDGHAGLTGLAILWSGAPFFPFTENSYLIGNNEKVPFPYGGEIAANGFTLAGYNTDIYPHSFYLRWQISDLGAALPVSIESAQTTPPITQPTLDAVTNLTGVVS
jgi:hypothetical protein